MKNLLLVFGFLLLPSVSLAAPLTQEQANSLINVVQSSPTTSASSFTNLITSFSNITIPQAESLIAVVQAAPQAPASAFVSMLIAFTVDTVDPVVSVQQQTPTLGNVAPVQNLQVEAVNNTPLTITPVVQSVVMEPPMVSMFTVDKLGEEQQLRISVSSPLIFADTVLPYGVSMVIRYNGKTGTIVRFQRSLPPQTAYYYEAVLTGATGSFDITVKAENGSTITRNVNIEE